MSRSSSRLSVPILAVWATLAGAAAAGPHASVPPAPSSPPAAAADVGILVIAHGANPTWNTPVKTAVARVSQTMPAEVAFLMGTPDQTPQQAYDKLAAAGAKRIVFVPLFVSSHSAHAEQVHFIAGRRPDYPHAEHMKLTQVKGNVPVIGVGHGMDDHPIVGDILADRARALSQDPAKESLIIVAHGPNEDDEAVRWTTAIQNVGARIRSKVPFKDVDVRLLRDDAPKPVKDKALAELRASVEAKGKSGRVVVVPLLMSAGRVATQIPEILAGLPFAWDGKTLLPDDRIADWILDEARRTAGQTAAPTAKPSASLNYDEQVVVTATRTEQPLVDVPVQTEVFDRAAIGDSGARTLADVLPYRLGLDVVPTLAGQGIQMQGIAERGVLILVDGQPVIGKISGGVDIGNLLLEDVERIEVVKGAASAMYGSEALGGVINILTRTATQPVAVSLEQRFESLDGRTTQATGGLRQGRWQGFLSASRIARDSYDLVPSEPSTTGSDLEKIGVSGKAGVQLGAATSLQVTTRYYGDDAQDVTVSSGRIRDDRVEDTRWQTIVDFRTKPEAAGALNVRAHVSRYEHSLDQTQRATGVTTPDLTHERMADFEAQYDRAIGTQHLVTGGTEVGRIGMTSDRITGGERNATTSVGYLQDQWIVTPRLHVVTGIRFDNNTEFGSAWSPKVALLFRGTEAIRLRASYGEGFKAPEFKDLYYLFSNRAAGYQVIGNTELRAEESRSLNSGVDVDTFGRRVRLSLTGFQHRIEDLIDNVFIGTDPASGIATYQATNVGAVRTRGLETEVTATPGSGVSAALGYMFLDAEDRVNDLPLAQRARHTVKGRVVARLDRWRVTGALFGRRLGERPYSVNSTTRAIETAPALTIFDARLAWDAHRLLQLFVGADNLTDEQHVRYFPSSGRRVYGGFTVRYAQ